MKFKRWVLILICVFIICYGIIKVSTETLNKSQFIRHNARFKILYSSNPFNFQIENDKYIFYINEELVTDIKYKSNEIYNSFISNFKTD